MLKNIFSIVLDKTFVTALLFPKVLLSVSLMTSLFAYCSTRLTPSTAITTTVVLPALLFHPFYRLCWQPAESRFQWARWPLGSFFGFSLGFTATWLHQHGLRLPYIAAGYPTIFIIQTSIAQYIVRHNLNPNSVFIIPTVLNDTADTTYVILCRPRLQVISVSYAIQACHSSAIQLVMLRLLCSRIGNGHFFQAPWWRIWIITAIQLFALNVLPLLARDLYNGVQNYVLMKSSSSASTVRFPICQCILDQEQVEPEAAQQSNEVEEV